jgi:hypothetical protein
LTVTQGYSESGLGARQISSFPLFPWCKKSAMHPLYNKADELSREAIAAAIEVHRHKGPGLIINFHELKLTDGVVRLILAGANR